MEFEFTLDTEPMKPVRIPLLNGKPIPGYPGLNEWDMAPWLRGYSDAAEGKEPANGDKHYLQGFIVGYSNTHPRKARGEPAITFTFDASADAIRVRSFGRVVAHFRGALHEEAEVWADGYTDGYSGYEPGEPVSYPLTYYQGFIQGMKEA